MNTAIISDIHANLEALEAVMGDIDSRRVERILCLGDIVNYGPDPVRCLQIVRGVDLSLLGNHEEAVLYEPLGFNPVAMEAAKWTRAVLEPCFWSHGGTFANWEFMRTLPVRHEEDSAVYVHASPRAPTSEYLLPSDAQGVLGEPSERLVECFRLIEHLCFVGHTHFPGVFTEPGHFASDAELGGEFDASARGKAIINVGSVGQPRDRNVKACYVTFDGEVVRFHRVAYDVDRTCAKVLAIPALPERCGTRLLRGE